MASKYQKVVKVVKNKGSMLGFNLLHPVPKVQWGQVVDRRKAWTHQTVAVKGTHTQNESD